MTNTATKATTARIRRTIATPEGSAPVLARTNPSPKPAPIGAPTFSAVIAASMWAQEREELGRDGRPRVGRADRPVAYPSQDKNAHPMRQKSAVLDHRLMGEVRVPPLAPECGLAGSTGVPARRRLGGLRLVTGPDGGVVRGTYAVSPRCPSMTPCPENSRCPRRSEGSSPWPRNCVRRG